MSISRIAVVAAAWLVLAIAGAAAQQTSATGGDWNFTLGAGVALQPEYEGANDYVAAPLPVLDIRYRDVAFLSALDSAGSIQDGLGWNAFKTPNFRVGPMATYYWGNSNRPTGINDVDPGFQIGAFAEFAFDHWKFDTRVLYGVSGSSEGARLNLGAAYGTRINKDWRVIARANTTVINANEMKTYFGVNSREASDSGLAEYSPGSGFYDVGLDVDLTYDVSKAWSVIGKVKSHYLIGDAADSPLVSVKGSEVQFYGGFGIAYHF
ncbi:MAG: MipA/OmpV family protein [Rhodospirillales bacterium]|nr:MipA/OmpV family protein [Rhodospirillales bacterium]